MEFILIQGLRLIVHLTDPLQLWEISSRDNPIESRTTFFCYKTYILKGNHTPRIIRVTYDRGDDPY